MGEAVNKSDRAGFPAASFLGQVLPPTRSEALRLGRLVSYSDGEDLLVEGTSSDFVLLLLHGFYKVVAAMETGREALLAIRVGGDLVGELGGTDGEPRIATVRASGTGHARRISRTEYLRFLARRPDAATAANRVVMDRFRVATRRQVEFATLPTATRIARILAELAATYGRRVPEGVMLTVEMTQPELAALAGTTEPTAHRLLANLRTDGVVATGYRNVVVLDPELLAERANL